MVVVLCCFMGWCYSKKVKRSMGYIVKWFYGEMVKG